MQCGGGGYIVLVAATLGGIGLLAFVKNSPDTRATLEGWIPGTDNFIKIVFQEDSSYFDFISNFFGSIKES